MQRNRIGVQVGFQALCAGAFNIRRHVIGKEQLVGFQLLAFQDTLKESSFRFRAMQKMGGIDVVENVILMQSMVDGVVGIVDIGAADYSIAFLL